MSLINEMLRDLDRREALAVADGQLPPGQVRAVAAPPPGRQWFWSLIAFLMLVALAWVAWVAYQVHAPRPVATELAFRAAEERKARPPEKPAAPPTPAPQAPDAQAKEPEPPELFKLAQLIETPIAAAVPQAPTPSAPPAQKKLRTPASASEPAVTRRDIPRLPPEHAEAQFRQGVAFLNQGRVSEAQEQFSLAIARYAPHQAARQALVSTLIERGRLEEARQLLEEGLQLHPGNLQFATVMARLLIERRDYRAAAGVLGAARASGEADADYQVLLGAVMQHLGRHAEATAAFEKAASLKPQPGTTWLALALSLEASGRKAEALDAYRRSLAGNSLGQEARSYAEGRVRSLR